MDIIRLPLFKSQNDSVDLMTLMITYTRPRLQTDVGGDQQIWHSIWKQLDKPAGSRTQSGDVTKINLHCPFFKHCGIILKCLVSQIISWSHNCLPPQARSMSRWHNAYLSNSNIGGETQRRLLSRCKCTTQIQSLVGLMPGLSQLWTGLTSFESAGWLNILQLHKLLSEFNKNYIWIHIF